MKLHSSSKPLGLRSNVGIRASRRLLPVMNVGTEPKPADAVDDLSKYDMTKSGLRVLGDAGRANALHPKVNSFEKVKREKCGTTAWTEIYELAALVREGKTSWDKLNLDDVDIRSKWNGMFHRRKHTPGKFMMRFRIPNGELTSAQLRYIATTIRPYGADGCGDITTRANLQIRGVTLEDADKIIDGLYNIGLTSKQSGMDNVRNITGNPIAGIDPHELIDTRPLCRAVDDMITGDRKGNADLANLPRKFNIAFNATRDDYVHTHINDLAFDAVVDPTTGKVGFNVIVGGYLSIKRCVESFPLDTFVPLEDVVPFTKAMLEMFREHGSRVDRQKARFIWLVEAWGIDKTREMLAQFMGRTEPLRRAVHQDHSVPWKRREVLGVHEQKQPGMFWAGANVPVGRIFADDLDAFADIADRYGDGTVRLTVDENVIFPNIPKAKVDALLNEPLFTRFSLMPGPLMSGLVSCTGAQFCSFGLTETKLPAVDIARQLESELDFANNVRIHWTGCPNSCGQAQVGEIGLIGAPAKKDGKAVPGVRIIGGGTIGEGAKLATTEFEKSVPLEDVKDKLKELLISQYGAKPKTPGGGAKVMAAVVTTPPPAPSADGPSTSARAAAASPAPLAAPAPSPATPPAAAAGPLATSSIFAPAVLYQKVVEAGVAKANLPWEKIALLGVLAGVYIGFGAFLSLSVGGSSPGLAAAGSPGLQRIISGLFGLPFGLTMVLVCGAELFTGNTALVTAAYYEKKATFAQLAKSWGVSLAGNLVGSLLLVAILAQSGLLAGSQSVFNIAVAKCSLPFGQAFFRGLCCNWLVCLAIWQSISSTSLSGKFIGVVLPISAFVACGFEHSVANLFILPFAQAIGAPITWAGIMSNIVPVTLGNMVAGALLVAGFYSTSYGTLFQKAK